jgi:hypothetical protein
LAAETVPSAVTTIWLVRGSTAQAVPGTSTRCRSIRLPDASSVALWSTRRGSAPTPRTRAGRLPEVLCGHQAAHSRFAADLQ